MAADNPPESVVDQRAIQFLPFVLRDAAYDSLMQLIEGTLEWRSENTSDSRPNREATSTYILGRVLPRIYLSVFCLKPHLSVGKGNRNDQANRRPVGRHILKVTQARTRLLAEAARSAPAHLSPHEHAWDVFFYGDV